MPDKKKETKKADKAKVVRINKGEVDEVFFHAEDPYQNFAVYSEAGKYKVGDTLDDSLPPATVQGNIEPAVG